MNEQEIKIGAVGKVIEGEDLGWFVFLKEDLEDSGGYFILIFNNQVMSKSTEIYDYWVENKEDLIPFFRDSNWKIEWLDEPILN
jgi:hypothetical protein